MTEATVSVSIRQIRMESEDTISFELCLPDEEELPPFSPGSHINVFIPGGPTRSYSLVNSPSERRHYKIAVKRAPDSRGGSIWLHDAARVGMTLKVSHPSNDFQLEENATSSILIGGGIGITPMMSMIARLIEMKHPWELHYSARTPRQMAFSEALQKLEAQGAGKVHRYFTGPQSQRMNLATITQSAPESAHLYCCGPSSLIDDFISLTSTRNENTVHYERFAATQEAATGGGFELQLARDGRCLPVPEGNSILDVLLDAGIDVQYACTEGVCGTCKTRVIDGIPDHRDDCLTTDEKAANNAIMICCSGSRTKTLTLDL